MKITRYLAIALGVVVILATIAWVLRNSIIERLSGPFLSEYGIEVTDVSLDALATENASISYLELEFENGTTIAIDELTLPISTSASGSKTYAANKVTIGLPMESEGQPLALARLVDQLLTLPQVLPATVVRITELAVASYPAVRDLQWSTNEGDQELTASLGAVNLSLHVDAKDDSNVEASFSLDLISVDRPEQTITLGLQQTDAGISLSGTSALDLPAIGMTATSIASSFGNTLAGIEFASGAAALEISGIIPYDVNEQTSMRAYLIPSPPFEFAYSVNSGVVNVVSVRSASPVKLDATYPLNQWSANAEQASLSMSYAQWNDISVSVSDLSCASGPSCFMNLQMTMNDADLTFATASRLELSASQDIVFRDDGIRLHVRPQAALSLQGLDASGTEIAAINALLTSDATLDIADSGWQLSAPSLDASIDSLSLDDDMAFSAPFLLQELSVIDSDQPFAARTKVDSTSGQLSWGSLDIGFPGFSGDVSLKGDAVVAELTTVGLHQEATIHAEHNLARDAGSVSIKDGALLFDGQNLSRRVSPWGNDWDITAGTTDFDLQFNWQGSDSGWQLDGQSFIELDNLAGAYGDTVLAGLSTRISATYETATGFSVEPATMQIDLLEVGLPIEDITAKYTAYPDTLTVDVENLRMRAFGGVIQADPFVFALESERNELLLHAESIELTELLTLQELEDIELTGSISAVLPVIIEGNEISIMDGTLTGEERGGVIRYQPGIVPDSDGTSAIGIVTEALSNFEYDTLNSTVGYSKDGDLILQMQIAGRNPDLEDSRPVVLNLGVENNIPQMLKSLQAARAVEEILEKRMAK